MSAPSKNSAVALIDVLGFKGIERNHDPAVIAETLVAARFTLEAAGKAAKNIGAHIHILGPNFALKRAWFSDTICLVAQPDAEVKHRSADEVQACLVDIVAFCVGYILRSAALFSTPLAFRGVVTSGNALVEGNDIYFGEAIAEASDLYETAEGAFVWLSPTAASVPPLFGRGMGQRSLLRYTVPLKGGRTIDTLVVNPFIDTAPSMAQGNDVRKGIERAMKGDRLDIAIKRQNTLRFLDHVAETEPVPVKREHGL
jgi:hypothetical protein